MLRVLTYSGSDGNRMARATHSPFLFRIPFGIYMDALEKAMPRLAPVELLAKAHAQLLLELVKKEVGWTFTSQEYDFSLENVSNFHRAFKEYKKRYKKLFAVSALTKKERADFLHFCGTHGLTLEGRRFLLQFRFKSLARRVLRPKRPVRKIDYEEASAPNS
jgi:hypothetical protein